MKLVDIQRAAALRDERQTAISKHNYLSSVLRPHIQIGGFEFLDSWEHIRPALLSQHRELIERLEAEIRAFGVEVEPHFKTDADGWLKPSSPLAEQLENWGYNLVETGGGCSAWVKVMADGDNVVVTDTNGAGHVGYDDWIVGRYNGDDWEDGVSQSSEENSAGHPLRLVLDTFENTPRKAKAEG